jgi:hypothetical protein
MSDEGVVSRLQGRKTLASLPGSRPRERPYREENPTADDDATLRRERVWRMETVEEAGNHEAPKTSFLHQVDFFKGALGNQSRP